ncbi:hypothetical protein ABH935_007678 [Catenulispora sp. GAS73]|uniref:hypothetical protein n=1 Tax=Catenulispora sp. GAS73 TaxID=3156269 RepID=UPI003517596B
MSTADAGAIVGVDLRDAKHGSTLAMQVAAVSVSRKALSDSCGGMRAEHLA